MGNLVVQAGVCRGTTIQVDIGGNSRNTPHRFRAFVASFEPPQDYPHNERAQRSSDHAMTQNPMVRPGVPDARASGAESNGTAPVQEQHELRHVAKTLAAYGGGALAFDLALDLVLNEVVEHARSATGATGAAIALTRGGEMECRATTGSSAPDLGVRLETESGLSGACITTGQIQSCSDTEEDARVDAKACRQLGVRSMLILPLSQGTQRFGILEVLSAAPNAFGQKDVEALQKLARRIVESKMEAESGANAPGPVQPEHAFPDSAETRQDRSEIPEPETARMDELQSSGRDDIWSTVLVVLVILVALTLGMLIGWRSAAQRRIGSRAGVTPAPAVAAPMQGSGSTEQPSAPDPAKEGTKPRFATQANAAAENSHIAVPTGGLVVTQNGKVIYRMAAPVPAKSAVDSSAGRLVHRVEPEYPPEARRQRIEGSVVLEIQVLSDGTVGNISIVKGNSLLTEAAVQAVRQWKYQPYVLDGRSVESQTRVTINFSLPPAS